jgi:hypothetical protein
VETAPLAALFRSGNPFVSQSASSGTRIDAHLAPSPLPAMRGAAGSYGCITIAIQPCLG